MKINQELIDVITLLDDYDYIVDSIDVYYRYIHYYKDENIIYESTFEDILSKEFLVGK